MSDTEKTPATKDFFFFDVSYHKNSDQRTHASSFPVESLQYFVKK